MCIDFDCRHAAHSTHTLALAVSCCSAQFTDAVDAVVAGAPSGAGLSTALGRQAGITAAIVVLGAFWSIESVAAAECEAGRTEG